MATPDGRWTRADGGRSGAVPASADAVEAEALSVSHWFEAESGGDPYTATVRFAGRRLGVVGKAGPMDAFVKEETVEHVVPGSGPVSITTWVYGLNPGEWTVTADLARRSRGPGPSRSDVGVSPAGARTLPRAAWSWRRWAVSSGEFTPLRTRPSLFVRMASMPGVVRGSWSGLLALGVVVGVVVQGMMLATSNVSVGQMLIIDALALLAGAVGAKLWHVVTRRSGSLRQRLREGWTVDGLIVGAVLAGAATLSAFNLPVGIFLDASAPGLFFGIAIGRLGCFLTGCCAGRCTRSRWGVWSSDRRVGARRVPTQLLESGVGLLIGVATTVAFVRYQPNAHGAIFVAALATYVLARQFLLRLRAEPHNATRARVTAAAAAVVLLADAAVWIANAG